MRRLFLVVAAALAGAALADPYVTETLVLDKGESWVYVEVTPTNAACAAVFADRPEVTSVMCYDARSYALTAQYDSEGKSVNQKPVAFLVWHRDTTSPSTLRNIVGGMAYVVKTTAACSLKLTGRPQLPRLQWFQTSASDDIWNLVAPSLPAEARDVTIPDYFGEGPAGNSPQAVERRNGELYPLSNVARTSLTPGRACYMTATRTAEWPGVIGVIGADDGLTFASNGTSQVTFDLQNRGTTNHTFEISWGAGQDGVPPPPLYYEGTNGWSDAFTSARLTLEPGEVRSITLAADRLSATSAAGGILTVSDLGKSKMRVRLPVVVQPDATSEWYARWPDGVYVGSFALNRVSYGTNATPVLAGGKVEGTLIFACTNGGRCGLLLQRLCIGVTADGKTFLGQDLAKARAKAQKGSTVRRISSVVLDPYQPRIASTLAGGRGVFSWTVGKYAQTNPMRHSWHPDHDGLRRQSDGSVILAPDGDVPKNYTESVKPELFSISNEVVLTGLPEANDTLSAIGGEVSGTIEWRLKGLRSAVGGGDIVCRGTYSLSRISASVILDD